VVIGISQQALDGHTSTKDSATTSQPKSPLTNYKAKVLYTVKPGPKEGTPEHANLARDVGYGHRNLLGEVLCAYVLCRLDVSFAVTTLAMFSINPAIEHHRALKRLAVYLRRQINWGIISPHDCLHCWKSRLN
jgi:hypothetical protein